MSLPNFENQPVTPGVEILIVEDSRTQALKLQYLLKQRGYRAAAARSGAEALAALQERRPAVVLSALVLSDMDGYELCRRIRARREGADVPVILMTALSDPDEILRVLECGADNFVAKPYDEETLLSRLRDTPGGGDRMLGLLLAAYETAVWERQAQLRLAGEAPASPVEPPAPGDGRPAPGDGRPAPGDEPPRRVLLAEDSAVSRRVALHVLEKQGHAVTAAVNGREALEAFAGHPFDLVLMDVEMPEMNGLEATAAIRQREKQTGGHVPIIAMTAHSAAEDRQRCLEAGMDGYVSKPLQAQELLAVLGSLPRAAAPPPFDREEALERVGGDWALLHEILDLFFEETPDLLQQMRDALAAGDAKTLERAAHSLKGSVATLGAGPAVEAAQNVETTARAQDMAGAAAALTRLEPAIAGLTQALRRLRDEGGKD